MHTLKERALHPLRRTSYDELRGRCAGSTFEVLRGEFFGIVGRNGSGKSTLLKCLAGIYRADAGKIELAGRLSPFIELGRRVQPRPPGPRQRRDQRGDDGADSHARRGPDSTRSSRSASSSGFVDQKLKNYSSGMQVRLAFSVMVHSDPDVMLIDEVLAVGDAAFQQKCLDVFYRLRSEGKTIVLVTHAMGLVEQFCHRAMMISDGQITQIGDPGGRRTRVPVGELPRRAASDFRGDRTAQAGVRLLDAWMTDAEGQRADAVAHGEPMQLHASIEALTPVTRSGHRDVGQQRGCACVCSRSARARTAGRWQISSRASASRSRSRRRTCSRPAATTSGAVVVRGTAGLECCSTRTARADIVSYGAELVALIEVPHSAQRIPRRAPRRPVT